MSAGSAGNAAGPSTSGTPGEGERELKRHYLPPTPPSIAHRVSPAHKQVLAELCARPELCLLTSGLALSVDPSLEVPFALADESHVLLAPESLADEEAAIAALRHAGELALWLRLAAARSAAGSDGERGWPEALALGILAARATAIDAARRRARVGLPSELAALLVADRCEWAALVDALRRHAASLLRLQGAHVEVTVEELAQHGGAIERLVTRAWPIAAPVEHLLTTGGDNRLKIDAQRALNQYGCSPRPRPWAITFASTTATSISAPAYAHAEALRRRLMQAALDGALEAAIVDSASAIQRAIREHCGNADSEVILTTSGTDAELYAIYLALAGAPTASLANVVIGPSETGSKVGVAAAGRHFDSVTPLGVVVRAGELLEGLAPDQVRVEEVAIRDADGTPRAVDAVDAETEERVARAVAEGRRVLLHVLDISKTGLLAPSLACVDRVRARHGDAVDVLVDACQLRLDRPALAAYAERGCLVMLTGSKFFTGPPFAGAIVVPRAVAERARAATWMLRGLSAYATADAWPRTWATAQAELPTVHNLGLLLRWEAALWEMRVFRAVAPARVRATLERFGQAVTRAIASRPHLALITTPPLRRPGVTPSGTWDEQPTIFTFTVAPGGKRLDAALLRDLYEWLNQDVAACLPDDATPRARTLAAKRCHIGQPIPIGKVDGVELAALRIAGGARLVSGVAFDPSLGETDERRLGNEIADALLVFEKLDLLLAHRDRIRARFVPRPE